MVSVLLRFLSTLSPCKAINNRDRTGCEDISFGSAFGDGETKLQDSELMSYEFTEEQKEWHDIFSDLI